MAFLIYQRFDDEDLRKRQIFLFDARVKNKISLEMNLHLQKHLMLCTVRELYSIFKENHQKIKIGLTKFQLLKPKGVHLSNGIQNFKNRF